ncbi:arginine N-succinyltransferase [Iodobacter fluviatilis]|uniref:Arginine N-succinyltransferase subunit beta n=1 Tax=Iodobacter fluviatilis TaxID=537 RepID=A0A377Q5E8_9NEIS|nr:arginine N-succinyltransferase [Iodobacter fluviatilis]TCU81490.1 arginine succinyltransferase [Iodobacter fluviatilis]STQ89940.1 Arginine N-succinyltransferase subunit beta [Iodobacter fluviatilis]
MKIVRLCQFSDVDKLVELAHKAGPGMTTLKPDPGAQAARIDRVRRTLEGSAQLADQGYLFLMEETDTGEIVGVCGIETAVGLEQPFYTYRIDTSVYASREMKIWSKMDKLTISHDLTGYTELCSLFLDPLHRVNCNGALLSKSRFMFLAQFSDRFGERVCAEMRGVFDEHGDSPFWRALGSHFYRIDFHEADRLVSLGQKSFLAELMPRFPVYIDFLPDDAKACIGATHKDTTPARHLLESEGLRLERHIDIFEAGPVLEARIDSLRVMRESGLCSVVISDSKKAPSAPHLIATSQLKTFRTGLIYTAPEQGLIMLTPAEAKALQVKTGDQVRMMEAYPRRVV